MTLSEINNSLNAFATEDLEILQTQGCLAVTDTKYGVLHLDLEDENVVAFADGKELLNTNDEDEVRDFLIESYTIEIANQ